MSNELERRPVRLPGRRLPVRTAIVSSAVAVTLSFFFVFDKTVEWDLDVRSKLIIGTPNAVEHTIRELPPVSITQRAAFPGAEGYGANATWGLRWRTEEVHRASFLPIVAAVAVPNDSVCNRSNAFIHFVTNTNSTGAGSWHEIITNDLHDDTLDIVIFNTGGTITISSEPIIANNCLYVAGQSAPGGGIQIRGPDDVSHIIDTFECEKTGLCDHIIARYLRLRPGKGSPGNGNGVDFKSGHDIILDHISANWAPGRSIGMVPQDTAGGGQALSDITVQWSIIGPTLVPHSTGHQWGADPGDPKIDNVTSHHNLYTHNNYRNPRLKNVDCAEVINNVVYNWKRGVTRTNGSDNHRICVDFVRNYYLAGPRAGTPILEHWLRDILPAFPNKLHLDANVADPFQTDSTADQQNLYVWNDDRAGGGLDGLPLDDSLFVDTKQTVPSVPVTQYSAYQAFDSVLAYAGAYQKLNDSACDGTWLNIRDNADTLFISQVRNGTGVTNDADMDHHDDFGDYPVLAAGTACTDSDSDGMPDVWEDANGLNKNDASDAKGDKDGDGYINLEEYLNGTAA